MWQANADAWGYCQPEMPKGYVHQPIRLPGQFEDELTGVVQNRFRDYASDRGRYLVADQLGLDGGFNSFRYTSNPLDFVDPLGLCISEVKPEGLLLTCGEDLPISGEDTPFMSEMVSTGFETMEYQEPSFWGFVQEEGLDVLMRTAQSVGGAGQVILGGMMCYGSGGLACVAGAAIGAKGVDNFQAGIRGTEAVAQQALVHATGSEQAGTLVNAGLDLGTSAFGLMRSVPKIGPLGQPERSLFRRDDKLYESALNQASETGLAVEGISGSVTGYGAATEMDWGGMSSEGGDN